MSEDREERLTIRQALMVWTFAAVSGWTLTVAVVWFASRVF